jgi:hypothetical protein
MIVALLDWTVERFQDELLSEELDPGLFSRQGKTPEKTAARIEQFLTLLRGAVATPSTSSKKPREGMRGPRPADEQ